MRSRQATSRLTCPARMSFTVINRVAMAHLHSHLAVVYHHDSPLLATSPHRLSHRTRRSEAEPRQIRPRSVSSAVRDGVLNEQMPCQLRRISVATHGFGPY